MSAIVGSKIKIFVTNGDAIPSNRTHGKSNTGTYFISSLNNFEEYETFFDEFGVYYLDLKRIKEYEILFKALFFDRRNEYPGKMRDFEETCESLLLLSDNPRVRIGLRINGNRVFMRFRDNNGFVEMSLRSIIYSKLTSLVIEKNGSSFSFFPEVNLEYV